MDKEEKEIDQMVIGGSGNFSRIEYKGSDSWDSVESIKSLPVREKRVPLTSDNVHQWVQDLIEKGVDTELETCDESLIG